MVQLAGPSADATGGGRASGSADGRPNALTVAPGPDNGLGDEGGEESPPAEDPEVGLDGDTVPDAD